MDYPAWIGHHKALIYITQGPISVKSEGPEVTAIAQDAAASSLTLKRASTEDRHMTKKAKIEINTAFQLSGDKTTTLRLSDSQVITDGMLVIFINLSMLTCLPSH